MQTIYDITVYLSRAALRPVQAVVIVLCLALQACSYSDSGFPSPREEFDLHIDEVRTHLLTHQMDQRSVAAAELNLPFDLKASNDVQYRGRFLLIHGLNDSPFIWRDMAVALTDRGFDVRAILLPGHGSTPEALLSMSYKRWLSAANAQVRLYRDPDKPFYLGGFSLGGVIATLLATESRKDPIDGLLLFSPAYQSKVNHLLRWAGVYSKFKPWVFGGMIIEDNPVKYNSIPINSGSQYYKTARALKRRWPRKPLNIPALVVASANDSILDVNYTIDSFDKGFTAEKKLIVYSNDINTSIQDDVEYRSSAYPDLRILNQSHQSVLVAPTNPLYGVNGEVRVCNGNEWAVFSRCLFYTGEPWLGAQHTPSPDEVPVARTTYNPDLAGVLDAFDALFVR